MMEIQDVVITCGEDASYCIWSTKPSIKTERSGNVERGVTSKKRNGKNAYKSLQCI